MKKLKLKLYSIEEAKEKGLKKCYKLQMAYHTDKKVNPYPVNSQISFKRYYKAMLKEGLWCLMAFDEKKAIGYVLARKDARNKKWIVFEDVFVKEKYRDQKIGERLMEKAIEIAKEQGYVYITISVSFNNVKAKKFFEKFDNIEKAKITYGIEIPLNEAKVDNAPEKEAA